MKPENQIGEEKTGEVLTLPSRSNTPTMSPCQRANYLGDMSIKGALAAEFTHPAQKFLYFLAHELAPCYHLPVLAWSLALTQLDVRI